MIGLVLIATTVAQANLQITVDKVLRAAKLRQTKVSLFAVDLKTNETLIHVNADDPMVPASNMKLITTAAALDSLGPEFIFRTELRVIGPDDWPGKEEQTVQFAHQGGTVLLVKGDGDPAFGDPKLLEQYHEMDGERLLGTWVDVVRSAGITHIDQVVIDDGVFDRELVHPSWPDDQLNRWYCAQVAGLNFFDNCLHVYPEPGQLNHSPHIVIRPEVPFLSTTNRATSGMADTFWVNRRMGNNDLTFMGKVKTRRSRPVKVTVHDPPMVFGQILADRLRRAGITVSGVGLAESEVPLPAGQPLHFVQTTLPAVLKRCNKDSHNLFAEALIKRMGHRVTGAPGSWHNGSAAVRIVLRRLLGPRAAVVHIADGSGMSRDNRVTVHILVDLIAAMVKDNKRGPTFVNSLSIAGVDGTLRKRMKELAPHLYAKTGYLNGVTALSGLLVLPEAEPAQIDGVGDDTLPRSVAFSFLFNDLRPPVYHYQAKALQDELIRLIHESYATNKVELGR